MSQIFIIRVNRQLQNCVNALQNLFFVFNHTFIFFIIIFLMMLSIFLCLLAIIALNHTFKWISYEWFVDQ